MKLVIDIDDEYYATIINKVKAIRNEASKNGYANNDVVPIGWVSIADGTPITERLKENRVKDFIKHKIDYLENLASIETNEGRWVEEGQYLYAISILEDVVEYISEMNGGGEE